MITDEEYFADRFFLRHGWLESFRRSPALFLQVIEEKSDGPSDAMKLGSAIHCWALERDQFHFRYVVAPRVDRRTKEGKAIWERFSAANAGKTILTEEQAATFTNACRSIGESQAAQSILRSIGRVEQVITWQQHGFGCKAKLDGVIFANDTPSILVDIKSTSDPYPEAFQKNLVNRGYHRQAAWYAGGVKTVWDLSDLPEFFFVAVGTVEPFEVFVYRLSVAAMEQGHHENEQTLSQLRECVESDNWSHPACAGVMTIDLPAWATKGVNV